MSRPLRLFRPLVASALISLSVALAPGAAAAATAPPGIEDVQVGERDLQTRIAFICVDACNLEKRGQTAFFLHGVSSDMSLDLSTRSDNVEGFQMTPEGDGSVLTIQPSRMIEYANTKPCNIAGRQASCLDLFFIDKVAVQAQLLTPTLAPQPNLREGAPERLSKYATLAPPERLSPPPGAQLATVKPVPETPVPAENAPAAAAAVDRPILREEKAAASAPQAPPFNYAKEAKALLGKTLTPAYCASARATLQADAWALEAMVDVGLCEAAYGSPEEAEKILARLLEYTPDNYEAYVGRALIALQAGEKSVARRYFQDALDAPPPIAESTRIVEAMRAL